MSFWQKLFGKKSEEKQEAPQNNENQAQVEASEIKVEMTESTQAVPPAQSMSEQAEAVESEQSVEVEATQTQTVPEEPTEAPAQEDLGTASFTVTEEEKHENQ